MKVESAIPYGIRADGTDTAIGPGPGVGPGVGVGPGARSGLGVGTDTGPNIPAPDLSALSALHLPVEPGLLALRLGSGPSRQGLFDGAWWPHSRDVHAELPGLIAVLSEHVGSVDRIGLDADAWDGLGEPLVAGGRLVQVDWFPLGDDTVLVGCGAFGDLALLAIPPGSSVDEAHASLTMATHIGSTENGQRILVATGIAQPAWHDGPSGVNGTDGT
ncbi:DUF5994 family protein [Streptomyces nanshensis]|uniref:DUF5994 family protein n=1 Tax=Streptomyces nanshensis TaxID=518642 RepID=UPI00099F4151|nr:DUF5994 family protein [Streptomyces nanshensis]